MKNTSYVHIIIGESGQSLWFTYRIAYDMTVCHIMFNATHLINANKEINIVVKCTKVELFRNRKWYFLRCEL